MQEQPIDISREKNEVNAYSFEGVGRIVMENLDARCMEYRYSRRKSRMRLLENIDFTPAIIRKTEQVLLIKAIQELIQEAKQKSQQ